MTMRNLKVFTCMMNFCISDILSKNLLATHQNFDKVINTIPPPPKKKSSDRQTDRHVLSLLRALTQIAKILIF